MTVGIVFDNRKTLTVCFLVLTCLVASDGVATAATFSICFRGGAVWEEPVLNELVTEFAQTGVQPVNEISIGRWDNLGNFERFCSGKCDVLVHSLPFSAEEEAIFEKQFPPDKSQPKKFVEGYVLAVVIVNASNSMQQITTDQIRGLLEMEGKGMRWVSFGVNRTGGEIHCYGEGKDSISRLLIRKLCMMLGSRHPTGYHMFREDFTSCADAKEVINKVSADVDGIGFILFQGQPTKGVKMLSVGKTIDGPFVLLKEGRNIQEDYPLLEPLVFHLRPNAPGAARAFCEFAAGEKGADILSRHGLVAAKQCAEVMGIQRLAEMKVGKGERVGAVGLRGSQKMVEALATEYVRAKAVVQMGYSSADTDSGAMGQFIGGDGKKGILLLNDHPSDQAMQAFGTRWSALNPPEHLVGARVVAVVVNPANKIESLTIAQVRAFFGGEIADWSLVPGTGLGSSTKTGGASAALAINCYSPPIGDPPSVIFQKEGLPGDKWRNVTRKKDSAEVLAAVATDSQGIGIMDLTAIPAGDKSVRVLAIGPLGKAVSPVPESLRNAMYPFAQRVYLYIHPKASDAAKDFGTFLATCGQSAGNLSTDTVKAVMAAYRQQGLVPLADVVLDRAAKDALAAPSK